MKAGVMETEIPENRGGGSVGCSPVTGGACGMVDVGLWKSSEVGFRRREEIG
jgi:hypothetical protein